MALISIDRKDASAPLCVQELKQAISRHTHIPVDHQKLVLEGRVLRTPMTRLSDLDFGESPTVRLDCSSLLRVLALDGDTIAYANIDKDEVDAVRSVADLKEAIGRQTGIGAELQTLVAADGRLLEDHWTLSYINFGDPPCVSLAQRDGEVDADSSGDEEADEPRPEVLRDSHGFEDRARAFADADAVSWADFPDLSSVLTGWLGGARVSKRSWGDNL